MFAADRLEQTPGMNHVLAQLGKRPASIRQPEFCRRLLSDSGNFIHLGLCNTRRSPLTAQALEIGNTLTRKGVQVGADRVDVNR
jgi:hypothetical protein